MPSPLAVFLLLFLVLVLILARGRPVVAVVTQLCRPRSAPPRRPHALGLPAAPSASAKPQTWALHETTCSVLWVLLLFLSHLAEVCAGRALSTARALTISRSFEAIHTQSPRSISRVLTHRVCHPPRLRPFSRPLLPPQRRSYHTKSTSIMGRGILAKTSSWFPVMAVHQYPVLDSSITDERE